MLGPSGGPTLSSEEAVTTAIAAKVKADKVDFQKEVLQKQTYKEKDSHSDRSERDWAEGWGGIGVMPPKTPKPRERSGRTRRRVAEALDEAAGLTKMIGSLLTFFHHQTISV
jgi:hypothetical protein